MVICAIEALLGVQLIPHPTDAEAFRRLALVLIGLYALAILHVDAAGRSPARVERLAQSAPGYVSTAREGRIAGSLLLSAFRFFPRDGV